MLKSKRSREECLALPYLRKTEIATLLQVSQTTAYRIYEAADKLDQQMQFRVEPSKVRMQSVMKVTEMNYNLLSKQIKSATPAK